jgi:hypothetical protein
MLNCRQIGEIARRSEGRRAGMKKTLVAAILVLVVGAGTFGQENPFEGLNGPVAKVEKWSYKTEEKFGDTVEVWDAHSVETYDANQNNIESIHYTKTGSISEHTVNTYNADQNNIESIHYTKTGSIHKRTVRTFGSDGRIIQADTYNSRGDLEQTILTRYEGSVRILRSYNAKGDLELAANAEFDADGNLTRMTMYDVKTADVSSVLEYTYTREGKTSSSRMYNAEGKLSTTTDYRYDVDGMDAASTFVVYLLGSEFMRTESRTVIMKTDEYGNWTEKRSYEHKERFGRVEWVLTNIYQREITYR